MAHLGHDETRDRILVLPHSCCVTLDKAPDLSEHQCSPLSQECDHLLVITQIYERMKGDTHVTDVAWPLACNKDSVNLTY